MAETAIHQEKVKLGFSVARKKRLFQLAVTLFLLIYAAVTLFPFYVLFVRTFVATKESTDLHLWIPPTENITMDAQLGNLSVYYNLEIKEFKQDMGIPAVDYIPARTTLKTISEKYHIPIEKMQAYFLGFSRYSGWITLFSKGTLWAPLLRTLVITIVSLLGLNLLSIGTGYGLAGLRRKDQMFIYSLYLLQMVIPPMLIILPQFMIVQRLQALLPNATPPGLPRNLYQILSVVLLNIQGGALTTMIYTSAINTIPKDLEESAMIDGATRWQYFTQILLPLLKVSVAVVIVVMLPSLWNQFLQPYVYLDTVNTTLLPFIQNYTGNYSTNFQVIYTGVLVSVLPLVIVYIAFRRWFISGVMSGAVKG
jgi:ABC-type glycerol-3-phosphate transport system permease component